MPATLLLCISCENDVKEIQRVFAEVDQTTRYYDIVASYSDSAIIRVEVSAPVMESRMPSPGHQEDHFTDGVEVEFYDDYGDASGHLTARHAVNEVRNEVITMTDSVVLYSTKGDTLRTEELVYDAKRQLLYTTGIFKYRSPDQKIYGYRFKTDPNFERFSYEKMSAVLSDAVALPK